MTLVSFIEYITEERLKYARGRDMDYANNSDSVICFNPKDGEEYTVRGKTHGLYSHAIKHLADYESELVFRLMGKIRNIIKSRIDNGTIGFCDIYVKDQGYKGIGLRNVISQASNGTILNTLDMINDKIQLRQKLSPIEDTIIKAAVPLKRRYEEIIYDNIDKSVDIDVCNSTQEVLDICAKLPVVKFTIKHAGVEKTIYLDLNKNSVVILTGKEIRSAFVFDEAAKGMRQVINVFLKKFSKAKIVSPYVDEAFRNNN